MNTLKTFLFFSCWLALPSQASSIIHCEDIFKSPVSSTDVRNSHELSLENNIKFNQLKLAAKKTNPAKLELAKTYLYGYLGRRRNYLEAFRLLTELSDANYSPSFLIFGKVYLESFHDQFYNKDYKNLPDFFNKFINWTIKAYQEGDLKAQYILAQLHLLSIDFSYEPLALSKLEKRHLVTSKIFHAHSKKGLSLLQDLANKGHAASIYELSKFYNKGLIINVGDKKQALLKKDKKQAILLLKNLLEQESKTNIISLPNKNLQEVSKINKSPSRLTKIEIQTSFLLVRFLSEENYQENKKEIQKLMANVFSHPENLSISIEPDIVEKAISLAFYYVKEPTMIADLDQGFLFLSSLIEKIGLINTYLAASNGLAHYDNDFLENKTYKKARIWHEHGDALVDYNNLSDAKHIYKEAETLYKSLSQKGDKWSQYYLALLLTSRLELGDLPHANATPEIMNLLEKAAKQNHLGALYLLSKIQYRGEGFVLQNKKQALQRLYKVFTIFEKMQKKQEQLNQQTKNNSQPKQLGYNSQPKQLENHSEAKQLENHSEAKQLENHSQPKQPKQHTLKAANDNDIL